MAAHAARACGRRLAGQKNPHCPTSANASLGADFARRVGSDRPFLFSGKRRDARRRGDEVERPFVGIDLIAGDQP